MTVPSRLPPDVWSRVLQHLHGPDKANAAQTCRDARAGSAGAWTSEDYWHAASGGQRLCSLAGQVPHDALPRAPASAHWRSLAREIGVARAHECNGLYTQGSDGVDFCVVTTELASPQPGLWLRRAAMEGPVPPEARAARWQVTAQALQSTGRPGEAAALAALGHDYAALQSGLATGNVAAVETLLERGVPLPPPNHVPPSVIPALARAACQQAGDGSESYLLDLFRYSDETSAQAILEQPAFATTNLPRRIAEWVILGPRVGSLQAVRAKARLLAAACNAAQADAVITGVTRAVTATLSKSYLVVGLTEVWQPLSELLPLWSARGTSPQPLAEWALGHIDAWPVRGNDADRQRLRLLSQHGADLDALIPWMLRRYAAQHHYDKWDRWAQRDNRALHALGQLGARIPQAHYDAIVATQPSESARERLRRACYALVAGGALPTHGLVGLAARCKARQKYAESSRIVW